jgi:hypothetical protein
LVILKALETTVEMTFPDALSKVSETVLEFARQHMGSSVAYFPVSTFQSPRLALSFCAEIFMFGLSSAGSVTSTSVDVSPRQPPRNRSVSFQSVLSGSVGEDGNVEDKDVSVSSEHSGVDDIDGLSPRNGLASAEKRISPSRKILLRVCTETVDDTDEIFGFDSNEDPLSQLIDAIRENDLKQLDALLQCQEILAVINERDAYVSIR